jgi:hypothetical protein
MAMEKKAGCAGMCHPSNGKKDHGPGWPGKKLNPKSKITRAKKTGGMAQAVKHLPNKHKALSSNCSTTKKKDYNMNRHL